MKVLITGGAGYLGLKIVRYLEPVVRLENSNPTEVIVLDTREAPEGWLTSFWRTPDGEKLEHVREVEPSQIKVRFVKGDVCNLEELKKLTEQVDVILHLAFVVGDPACRNNPEIATRLALTGTENVVKASQKKMIVFSSSDAVYGNEVTGLCDEKTPCNSSSLYGKLKLQCEEIVRESFNYCILRIPSSFGSSPAMRWDNLVHYLFKQMFDHGKISISDPQVTRTLIDVRDVARAFIYVMQNQEKFSGKTLHIASGAWTKKVITEIIARIMHGRVLYNQTFIDPNVRNFILDCSAINKMGWYPKFDLEDGIRHLEDTLRSSWIYWLFPRFELDEINWF